MRLLFEAIRLLGRLPPWMLLAILWPLSLARGTIDVLIRDRRPPTELPPRGSARGGWRAAVLDRAVYRITALAGFWADRSLEPAWASRFDLSAIDELRGDLAERPMLMVSLHYGGLVMVPPLLCARGVPTALAVNRNSWPLSRLRQWRLKLTQVGDVPPAVPADARAMLRFMQPGRCLVVAIDYPSGELAEVPFAGANVRLATPPLRLARMAGATVVPMLAVSDGPWRMTMRLGRPVPDELIRNGDYHAAAAHVAAELLPLAAAAPDQALPTLVEAFTSGDGAAPAPESA